MYQNPIYSIKAPEERSFLIGLHPDHRIFAAHFPGNPVLPGACIIDIFNHLTKLIQSDASKLVHIRQVKFLKMIHPEEYPCIRFTFDSISQERETLLTKVSVTSPDGSVLFAKLSASYVIG